MLQAEQVEQAFVETAEEQTGGPFDWRKLAAKLNERLADQRDTMLENRPLMLQRATVGVDGPATGGAR